MKKLTSIIMTLMLATSLTACGSSENASASSSEASSTSETITESVAEETAATSVSEEKPEAEKEEKAPEEKIEDSEDYKELSALGDVEVEDGLLTVKITVPADIMGEITQEELDASAGETYISAQLNDDGSVTYKMTKAQHKLMLDQIVNSVKEGNKTLIDDDENYSISDITFNKNLTEFKVTIDGDTVGLGDSFAAVILYMYGGMYGIFTGETPENIKVEYVDSEGNVLETANSSEME